MGSGDFCNILGTLPWVITGIHVNPQGDRAVVPINPGVQVTPPKPWVEAGVHMNLSDKT